MAREVSGSCRNKNEKLRWGQCPSSPKDTFGGGAAPASDRSGGRGRGCGVGELHQDHKELMDTPMMEEERWGELEMVRQSRGNRGGRRGLADGRRWSGEDSRHVGWRFIGGASRGDRDRPSMSREHWRAHGHTGWSVLTAHAHCQ
jgi:hypothetical protein